MSSKKLCQTRLPPVLRHKVTFVYECWAGAWVELCGAMKFLDNLAGTMPQTLRDGGLHVIRCESTQGMAAAVIEALLPIRRGVRVLCWVRHSLSLAMSRGSRWRGRRVCCPAPTGRAHHDDLGSATERPAPALRGFCPPRGLRLTGQIRRAGGQIQSHLSRFTFYGMLGLH